jgi:diguanylate cyclase (GGDEF)-like protein/PAS domain S-box-containing protein
MPNTPQWSTLIVQLDDEEMRLLQQVLQARGHQVSRWSGEAESIEDLDAEVCHLVIMPWDPVRTEVRCRALRALPQCSHAVVVAVTDPLRSPEPEQMVHAGVNDCLVRPLQPERLGTRLRFLEQWIRTRMESFWAEQALRESEERSRDLFENAPLGIYQTTPDGEMLLANPQMARMLGYESFEEMAALNLEKNGFWPSYPRARFKEQIERDGEIRGYEAAWKRRDGKVLFVRENARVVRDLDGNLLYYTGTVEDITEQRQAEQALEASEQRYELAASGAKDGLWEWDLQTDRVELSPRWRQMLGLDPEPLSVDSEQWFERVHPEDEESLRVELEAHFRGGTPHFEREHRMKHADGSWRWMLTRGVAVRDSEGTPLRMAGSMTDVTERREAEEQLLHHALHDRLTELPNRALFMDRLRRAVAVSRRRPDYQLAVVVLDLDRFKLINESLGHERGEKILEEAAARLLSCVRSGDTLARVGGDEFALLLEDLQDIGEARKAVDELQRSLTRPIHLAGNEVFITSSVGIAPHHDEYERAEDLLRDAEIAMYRAKTLGRARHVVFDHSMRARAVAWLQIENHLRHALEREELRLYYQPIVSLQSGQITGFEALLRWKHPELGLIPPAKFVHVAEESGLIVPIGQWVLREACLQTRRWQSRLASHRRLGINVNLSGRQFNDRTLLDKVARVLQDTEISPPTLKLEITESVLMEDRGLALKLLRELRSLDVLMGIDDFGTGYSSFSHLEMFPIDTLKIDRSFVSKMGASGDKTEIIDTIVSLGRNLGLDVVAEGVETEGQLHQLRQCRCQFAQGYLFSPPVNHEQAEELLVKNPRW